ncbi:MULTISPECIES: threonine/serine exporter family protein [unclassified Curtobacterium]|uniref:threonine/serine exporter family protein n=1 Tax=unclassified Curtobacterium TaxID=257496 RepID=UPI0008DD45AE|nr:MULTISPECIES: threonine/serine exporter family protein [unclassified Curtobacterium]WIA97657.1 threonine/serine exporter family protein [Curtobacterium sp. MCBA15_004]WIB00932.1 threonine/serine exporter family protein [Curtobacterium sp. MCBA15_012]
MVGLGSALANLRNALGRPEAHVEVVDGETVPTGMLLGTLGALLLDAGSSVTDVRSALEKARDTAGVGPSLAIGVLPALVMVSETSTGAATIVNAEGVELSFRQVARANRLVLGLESGSIALAEIPARVRAIRAVTVPPPGLPWVLGNALTSAGLAVVFRCPWWAVLVALGVGALVGVLSLVLRRFREAVAIVPFLAAFGSTSIVGLVAAGTGFDHVPLYAVCAPVAVFVPGALITNALLELTAADIVTGASRLVQGLIMLGFMAAGIAAGSALTGLRVDPASAALVGEVAGVGTDRAGWEAVPPYWVSWVAVALLAVGISLVFVAGWKLTVASVVVMTAAYALVSGVTPIAGSVVATGVTAAVLFVATRLLERLVPAIPATVSFLPAFLLLVPGTVGLVAVATSDPVALGTPIATFVSLCIGTKLGGLLPGLFRRNAPHTRSIPTMPVDEPSP